jgi:hypothetical protein
MQNGDRCRSVGALFFAYTGSPTGSKLNISLPLYNMNIWEVPQNELDAVTLFQEYGIIPTDKFCENGQVFWQCHTKPCKNNASVHVKVEGKNFKKMWSRETHKRTMEKPWSRETHMWTEWSRETHKYPKIKYLNIKFSTKILYHPPTEKS